MALVVAFGLLLLGSMMVHRRPWPRSPPLHVTYMNQNEDPFLKTKPIDIKDLCNRLPEPRHPRGLFISHKTVDQPLKIFYWHQATYATYSTVDWVKESQSLCPISLVLQPFFDHYRTKMFHHLKLQWPQGYAPCYFFTAPFDQVDTKKQCNTPKHGMLDYTLSTNYTAFEEADIVIIDYPFYDTMETVPYFDSRNLPPRITDQKWVFWYGGESLASYAYLATPMYQSQFDLTMGAPPSMMDVPIPVYEVTKDFALKLANTPPSFAFDQKPQHYAGIMVSNCEPKNNRNGLMKALIDKAGAHSFGACMHNMEMPDDYKIDTNHWGDWVNNKLKMLGAYPFVFAGENSNCVGYVTEKIYNALEAGAIPIYLGAQDIADFVPEGSFVDASKFENFDAVVEYIKTVERSQFYEWKDQVKADVGKFCKKCFKVEEEPWCNILKKVNFV
ncbi:putative glycoprotein 3-alpha-L-fucosyltransferase [Podila humilis]|nr:putative glycoprotein 3-alpha-L-fucosyltransferase [Podila humilis]